MNKLLCFFSLLGTLLIAGTVMAQLHDLTTVDETKLGTGNSGLYAAPTVHYTGIQLGLGVNMVRWWDAVDTMDWVNVGNGTAGDTFNFGSAGLDIDLEILGATTTNYDSYAAVFTNVGDGTFHLGASIINVYGTSCDTLGLSAGNLVGFYYRSLTNDPFTGIVNGADTTITVDATNSMAIGVWFRGTAGLDGANITFGDIEAKHSGPIEAGAVGATAFKATTLAGNTQVNLGHIKASTDEDTFAIGAQISGIEAGSSLTIDQITANSARSAGGLLVEGNSNGTITVGTVGVTGVGDSYGIQVQNMANLTLTGDIEVTSTTDRSSGIVINGDLTGNVLGGKDITAKGDNLAIGFGVGGQIHNGTNIQLGNITAAGKGANDYAQAAVGFVSVGTLTGGTTVIDTITVRGENRAAGFGVGDLLMGTTADVTGGTITVGEIDVTAANGDALGWISGTVGGGAALDLGTITVNADANGGASGIYVNGDFAGKLSVDRIEATGASNGINATTAGIAVFGGSLNAAPGSTIGTIHAQATGTAIGENVYGVVVGGPGSANSHFTATNDITAEVFGTGAGSAMGISMQGGASTVEVANPVAITARNGGGGRAIGIDMAGNGNHVTAVYDAAINATSNTGEAYGVLFSGNNATADIAGKITATSSMTGNAGAAGFAAYGANNGNITLGDIEARGNWAVGAHFTENLTGDLAIGDVLVESGQYEATGLAVGNYAGVVNPANAGKVTVGNIAVSSQNANAFGIRAGAVNNLVLEGDITVEGWGNDTSGIRTYDSANITLLNQDVTFSTTHTGLAGTWVGADIWSDGHLNINLNGQNLTAEYVKVDGGSNLTVRGNGNANLDVINVSGDFNIGVNQDKTTVTVDGVKMLETGANLGNVKFGEAGTLNIFGNTKQLGAIGMLDDATQEGQIVNLSTFTKWGYNPVTKNIESFGTRDTVFANDNYLAAAMIHHKYTAWNAVRNHLISGSNYDSYGYYGQAPCDCAGSCSPSCKPVKSRSAWGNYIGRDSHYRSVFNNNDWHLSTNGVQVGTDFFQNYKTQIGAFFGYEDSIGKNWGDRITAKDYYVGMYGVHVFNTGVDIRTVFGYGWQDFISRRNGADRNLYRTSFSGNTAELTVEVGKRHYCGGYFGTWSVRPAIAVDWYLNQLGNAVETSGEQALRYHRTDFSQLFFRFGTDLRYETGRWSVEGGLFYSYDMRGDDFWAKVSDAATGGYTSRIVSSKLGRSVLTFNVGSSYQVGRNFSLFGGYRGEVTPEQAGKGYIHTGYVGGAWRW